MRLRRGIQPNNVDGPIVLVEAHRKRVVEMNNSQTCRGNSNKLPAAAVLKMYETKNMMAAGRRPTDPNGRTPRFSHSSCTRHPSHGRVREPLRVGGVALLLVLPVVQGRAHHRSAAASRAHCAAAGGRRHRHRVFGAGLAQAPVCAVRSALFCRPCCPLSPSSS
jgi:hypothetical protein